MNSYVIGWPRGADWIISGNWIIPTTGNDFFDVSDFSSHGKAFSSQKCRRRRMKTTSVYTVTMAEFQFLAIVLET